MPPRVNRQRLPFSQSFGFKESRDKEIQMKVTAPLFLTALATATIFCFSNISTALAQSPSDSKSAPKQDTGDVDMTQFNHLKRKSKQPKLKIDYSCQDLTGKVFNKDEPGFQRCLENSQSALMNKNKPVEAPSGERTQ
jgi:hypothetical protein